MLNDMRHRIYFNETSGSDGRIPRRGETLPESTCVYTCRAKVDGLKGREYYAAAAIQREHTHKFTVRDCKAFREKVHDNKNPLTLIFNENAYIIENILPNYSRKNFVTIRARTVT
ncbi:phage head closure protein [Bacillus velezensis]|uniref:phage head closure protein n=1 Tax=Bacillus amyloliquefaciens group TaxID=1938374 RepID=UPI000397D05F|nr:hypothetical protein O205_21265 [Bacillus amyloliquefaciens EGD-AQ14]